jgi:heme/copper-type cytochrome/quinol oxidase subunit 3
VFSIKFEKPLKQMKKIIILPMLLAFVAVSFGQQTTPKPDWKDSEYYKKSKNQKTAAWIFLGSGVAMFTGGLISHFNYINNQDDPTAELTQVTTGEFVALAGVIVAGGSIPFFIASSKNKQKAKAASVFIDMEHAPVLQGAVFNNQSFPVVGVKIQL